jgi:[ribosomal protein S5]-alanine N-acetyltransferase
MIATPTSRWLGADIELFLLEESHVGMHYVAWLNDPDVNRYLESRFGTHTLESTRAFVRDCRAHEQVLMLGIRSQALSGRHVGNIKLQPIDRRHGLGEVGILIGDRAAWGQGIATQAIAALCAIAQHELGLRKLTAGCYASNAGSERAFVRAGFEVEGRRPRHFVIDGLFEDLVLMSRHLTTESKAASPRP